MATFSLITEFFFITLRTCEWLSSDKESNTDLFVTVPIYTVLGVSCFILESPFIKNFIQGKFYLAGFHFAGHS